MDGRGMNPVEEGEVELVELVKENYYYCSSDPFLEPKQLNSMIWEDAVLEKAQQADCERKEAVMM